MPGKHVASKLQGVYKQMHGGLVTEIAHAKPLDDEDLSLAELSDDHEHMFMGGLYTAPHILAESGGL